MTIDKSKIEQNFNEVTTETFSELKVLQGKLIFDESAFDGDLGINPKSKKSWK